MTRVDTPSPPHGITIKQTNTNLCRSAIVILLATFVIAAFFVIKKPADILDDPEFVVKSMPSVYTKLEGVDPDERELFEGFRTSFLPVEEVLLAGRSKHKRDVDGSKSDMFIWDSENQVEAPTRLKRMSQFPTTSQVHKEADPLQRMLAPFEDVDEDSTEESEEEYESAEAIVNNEESEAIESMVRPQKHIDRGPLDDVVEQIRGQPELEEEEMDSSAHLHKPPKEPSGIHAFWKGQGDRETIRNTQANIMRRNMDVEADPCHDFYQYACGNWATLNPIPADKAGYDTFEMLRENLDTVLKNLLEFDSEEWVLSKYPGPHLDTHYNFLHNLKKWKNGLNSHKYIDVIEANARLPTREYFLQDSNRIYLNAYKNYLIKVALLLGGDPIYVRNSADKLIDFEIRLAKITSAPEDRRNVSELYRRMTLQKMMHLVPEVNWRRYLCVVMNRTVDLNETVVLFALNYVRHLVKLIDETDPSILSNYLLWRFVRHRVNNLDDRFQSAKQQFYFILFGREQAPPRWKNCISQVNSNMGMALGSMFVKKYFDETSKNDTLTMTCEIQQSFRELLHKIDWIDSETKKLAAHKVDAMMLRIGYPDFILNKVELDERYKEVKIHPDMYFENILNILQHLTQMEQSRIGQPVNKTLWNTAPAVVNAYYSRNKNQIMFPAGILQPPFYHRHFPRSLNYGGIGVVIGHEITHGFDDKGRLFDCNGNLHRWWSDSAIEAFHHRAQCLIDQYGRYVVPEVNMKLDGVNTQGENIADNGGVKQAFRAYTHWVQRHGTAGETLPGLNHTHTQLFFLNFAQVWCGAMRPEAMRNKLKTAVHSPGRFRVIGTLSNSQDFAREFHCPPGSPMNPVNKCTVW
ncbi:hypothetical protein MSG28_004235 [Choristoneura fumiferana]|uniref:Uncharacterized protein n=1 Tax=Choristoneura fumiferana TaxID=7141 RepID=A0ACC0KIW8_CHOFU|nr:hypothetical protein MSG28_004235 [Choristoneura fumiferana]